MEEHEQRCRERDDKIRHIERTKERVKEEFKHIERMCSWPCEEIIEGLERYIDRMIRISTDSSISRDLKPYDTFYNGKLRKNSILSDSFHIILDKNLEPKFAPEMVEYSEIRNEDIDIELEACMDLKQLEEFTNKCKKIIMDKKIEDHRKKLVEDKLK